MQLLWNERRTNEKIITTIFIEDAYFTLKKPLKKGPPTKKR